MRHPPYANLGNPQTLNLYAFVADNPSTFADLDGHSNTVGGEWQFISLGRADPGNCGGVLGCSGQIAEAFLEDLTTNTSPEVRAEEKVQEKQTQELEKARKHKTKPKTKQRSRPLVKEQKGAKVSQTKAAANRDVYYYAVTPDAKGNIRTVPGSVLTLSEKFIGAPGAVTIANPPQTEKNPSYIAHGEYEDGQSVLSGSGYTLERRWSVNGVPAGVLDDQNKARDYEILHADNAATPPFSIEYGDDPKP